MTGEKKAEGRRTVTMRVWHIAISSVMGFILGILTLAIVLCVRRWFIHRKHQLSRELQASKDGSNLYEEMDLNRLDPERDYQTPRSNVPTYEPGNNSVYTDLHQCTTEDNNHYQSLVQPREIIY